MPRAHPSPGPMGPLHAEVHPCPWPIHPEGSSGPIQPRAHPSRGPIPPWPMGHGDPSIHAHCPSMPRAYPSRGPMEAQPCRRLIPWANLFLGSMGTHPCAWPIHLEGPLDSIHTRKPMGPFSLGPSIPSAYLCLGHIHPYIGPMGVHLVYPCTDV